MDLAQPHEQMPVAMPKPLTRMVWLGTGLQVALGGALLLAHAAHATVTGAWLVLVTLAARSCCTRRLDASANSHS